MTNAKRSMMLSLLLSGATTIYMQPSAAQTVAPSAPPANTSPTEVGQAASTEGGTEQSIAPNTTNERPDAPSPAPAAADIVVTGSRISRRDFVSPTPVITTSQEALRSGGTINVEASLNQLPQFVAGGNASNGGRGAGQRATLNLRGLGSSRNLVLLDGRRLPPAGPFGEVDVNIIPQGIVESVETITGGASTAYGSDAISGVVNFKTRRSINGIEADVQVGDSTRFDYATVDANILAGSEFAESRGHVMASVSYTHRDNLPASKRSFYDLGNLASILGYGAYTPSASNLPTSAAVNAVFAKYGVSKTVSNSNNIGFNDNGTLFSPTGALNYLGRTSGDYVLFNGDVRQPFARQQDLLSRQDRKIFYGKADFDLTDSITVYGQALYVDSSTDQDDATTSTQFGTLVTMPVTNPFIPADLKTILASRPNPTAPFTLTLRYVGVPHKGFTDTYHTNQILGGIRGKTGVGDFNFDLYVAQDRSTHQDVQRYAVLKSRVQALYNAADGGNSICQGGFNPFGDAENRSLSPACINYLTTTVTTSEDVGQTTIEGSLEGSLFRLPAGDLKLSLSADRRTNRYNFTPDYLLTLGTGTIEGITASYPTRGSIAVNEVAAEVLVPVLKDTRFAESLNLGAAYRYSNYNTVGGTSTYKFDVDWTVTTGLLLRAGYAQAIRAPNVGELFSAPTGSTLTLGATPAGGDPCDVRATVRQQGGASLQALCVATGVPAAIAGTYQYATTGTNLISSGNLGLRPEVGKTITAGVVWRPTFVPRLTFSADYFHIAIDRVISVIPGLSALSKCYNLDGSNPSYSASNPYCALISRDSNGQLQSVSTPYLNLGGRIVEGIDFAVDWHRELFRGEFSANSQITLRLHDKTAQLPGDPFQDFVDTNGRARAQALTTFGYRQGPADIGIRWRFVAAASDPTIITAPTRVLAGTSAYHLFDLVGTYRVAPKIALRAGLTNVFDRDPVVVGGLPGVTDRGLYDVVGRAFYFGIKAAL